METKMWCRDCKMWGTPDQNAKTGDPCGNCSSRETVLFREEPPLDSQMNTPHGALSEEENKLRDKFGGRADETFYDFVDRLGKERDAAQAGAGSRCTVVSPVAELSRQEDDGQEMLGNKQKVIEALRGAIASIESDGEPDRNGVEYLAVGPETHSFGSLEEVVGMTKGFLEPDEEWHPEILLTGWSVVVSVEEAVILSSELDPSGDFDEIVEYGLGPVCLCGAEIIRSDGKQLFPHKPWCPKAKP